MSIRSHQKLDILSILLLIILSSCPHLIMLSILTQVTLNGPLLLAIALLTEEERSQLIIIVKPRQVYSLYNYAVKTFK